MLCYFFLFVTFSAAPIACLAVCAGEKRSLLARTGESAVIAIVGGVVCVVSFSCVPFLAVPVVGLLVGTVCGLVLWSVSGLGDSSEKRTTRRIIPIVVSTIVGLIVVGTVVGFWFGHYLPRRHFHQLVSGSASIQLSSVDFTGQGRRVVLADEETLRYLTRAFRSAQYEGYITRRTGTSYTVDLSFNKIGSMSLDGAVPDDTNDGTNDGFAVGYIEDVNGMGDPIYYWVSLEAPVPAPLLRALEQLRRHHVVD